MPRPLALAALLLAFAVPPAHAQGCFGPVCVTPGPVGPPDLCLPDGCRPIAYDRAACPDVFNQAAADLLTNALRANRARRLAP